MTHLQEAVNGNYKELTQFLIDKGGKLWRDGKVSCLQSSLCRYAL